MLYAFFTIFLYVIPMIICNISLFFFIKDGIESTSTFTVKDVLISSVLFLCSIVPAMNICIMFMFLDISTVWDKVLNFEVYTPKQKNEEVDD